MSLIANNFNQRSIKEIIIILTIKIILLLTIKYIWFNTPTIPPNFNTQAAEHIAGNSSSIKETR